MYGEALVHANREARRRLRARQSRRHRRHLLEASRIVYGVLREHSIEPDTQWKLAHALFTPRTPQRDIRNALSAGLSVLHEYNLIEPYRALLGAL